MGCGPSKSENDRDSSVMETHGDVADEVNTRMRWFCWVGKVRLARAAELEPKNLTDFGD